MSHRLRMLLGCVLPLLLIFVLPLLGISGGVSLTLLIVLMFACHVSMMSGHGGGHRHAGAPGPHGPDGSDTDEPA